MKNTLIIAKTSSSNFAWGIYGFCKKVLWEDIKFYNQDDVHLASTCLNSKTYLREALPELRGKPEELLFAKAVEQFLADDSCHYWYYYDREGRDAEDFYEVPYWGPKNEDGIKPRSIETWHPDERLGIESLQSGAKAFLSKHLGIENCEIIVDYESDESFEESLQSFKEYAEVFWGEKSPKIEFSDDLVQQLSHLWQRSKDEVLQRLMNASK
ncbi:MAG: hypothetical protein R8P61_17900 [Bacteroidia bacterium]|nr:hypothetical protein [Bacteroidia bacterium]